jgi:hypothetical protein
MEFPLARRTPLIFTTLSFTSMHGAMPMPARMTLKPVINRHHLLTEQPYIKIMGCADVTQMNEVATAVGPEANLILKINDKEGVQRSLACMESCLPKEPILDEKKLATHGLFTRCMKRVKPTQG